MDVELEGGDRDQDQDQDQDKDKEKEKEKAMEREKDDGFRISTVWISRMRAWEPGSLGDYVIDHFDSSIISCS